MALILSTVQGTALAQGTSPSGLRTNEILVSMTVFVTTTRTTSRIISPGETLVTTEKGTFKALGEFAAIMDVPEAGKRELYLFRRLPGKFTGSLEESYTRNMEGSFGEGGLGSRKNNAHAEWIHDGVDLSSPLLTFELDLDAKTYRIRNSDSAVDSLLNSTIRGFSYAASRHGPDSNEKIRLTTTSNPNKPLIDVPAGTPKQLQAALISLTPHWTSLELSHGFDVVTGLGFAAYYEPPPVVVGDRTSGLLVFWKIHTEGAPLELRVTSPDLEHWRPKANRVVVSPGSVRIDPGPPIALTARIVDPSGRTPQVRIRKLTWWLEDTSRLPGIAMNYPYEATDHDFDLDIDHPNATDEGQRLEVKDLTTLAHTIKVRPHDWGAWAVLRVEAELDDGRTLKGILATQKGDQNAIRIPAREPDSKIADSWKRRIGAVGSKDDDDLDFIPAGGSNGDGLTTFEEYRGFYAWDLFGPGASAEPTHVSTNPDGKTVFVFDRIGDQATGKAIGLFQAASQAYVFLIKPGFGLLGESRVLNANPGTGPTKGPQHAIGMRRGGTWLPATPGSPGQSEVQVPSFEAIQRAFPNLARADLYQRAIAAQLFMACHVPRPGSGDRYVTLRLSRAPDGSPLVQDEAGNPVQLRDELSDADLAEAWVRQAEWSGTVLQVRSGLSSQPGFTRGLKVAVRGGQHSGPLANIMRSADAEAYSLDGGSRLMILSPTLPEQIGYSLPATAKGDGYNDPNLPRHRYGDSPQRAPRESFRVSDHAP
ncbi:MAG: hypothetical protein IT581_03630 [Verrucomicrobiales bacterium]|nr:hypothetical protein [Verrucomicrobiales bacterium]